MKKWNYAVMKSIFGNLWVGKTKLPIQSNRVFADIKDAQAKAEDLFVEMHEDFDPYNDEENKVALQEEYETLAEEIDDIEEIRKPLEKFII